MPIGIKDTKSVDQESTLAELGMDSIMGIEIAQALQNYDVSTMSTVNIRSLTFSRLIQIEEELKKPSK